MKKTLSVFICALLITVNAYANSWGKDRSDVWWDPNESGWGAFIAQQQNIIYMGLYVYDDNNLPTWFVTTLWYDGASSSYSGDLYTATGPSHAGPFDPNLVARKLIGSLNLVVIDDNRLNLTYTAYGKTVQKVIERMTWASNQLSGSFFGGLIGVTSNCNPASLNGYLSLLSNMTIVHAGDKLRIEGTFTNNRNGSGRCTFDATYKQSGRLGAADGGYSCTTGEVGTFTLESLEATAHGMLAYASAKSNVCSFEGRFGAIRNY